MPEPFARQIVTEDTLTNRTPEAHEWAVKRFREIRHDGQFVPLSTGKDTFVDPSFEGGAEWGGPAIDPHTNVLYINSNNYASLGALAESSGGSPGRITYLNQCGVCHGDHRQGSNEFPPLLNISHKLTVEQIEAAIHNGNGRMPAMPLEGNTLNQLLDYLATDNNPPSGDRTGNEEPAAKDTIAAAQQAASPEPTSQAGAEIYQAQCAICHGERLEGIAPSFPALLGVGSRLSNEKLLEVIRAGKGRMPGFPALSSEETDALMRFLHPPAQIREAEGARRYTFTGYRRFVDPDGYPATATPWGTLNALDLETGNYLWQIPLGQYPELAARGMPDTGSENYGGPIVTAGGLVLIAATNFDHKIRAFDKTTGKLLWEATLPFAGNATPATYEVNGRQFVVIAAGGTSMNPRGPTGGVYVAFALPQ
jgi:mono/diheme cytochrome c family protein